MNHDSVETVALAVTEWVEAATRKDGPALKNLLSENVVLLPPFRDDALHGPADTLMTLASFAKATRDFTYGRTWCSGNTAVLEFRADIEGRALHGLDLIEFDDHGKIVRFEVMARPHSAVSLLRSAVLGTA